MTDLQKDSWYTGIVTNITQFGAFVDIGIKENGLIHVSEMADHFVSNALEVLKIGQEVKARVMDVDLERGRISLSLKKESSSESRGPKKSSHTEVNNYQKVKTKGQKEGHKNLRNNAFATLKNFKVK